MVKAPIRTLDCPVKDLRIQASFEIKCHDPFVERGAPSPIFMIDTAGLMGVSLTSGLGNMAKFVPKIFRSNGDAAESCSRDLPEVDQSH